MLFTTRSFITRSRFRPGTLRSGTVRRPASALRTIRQSFALLALMLVALLVAPLGSGAALHAQSACTSVDPPCPPPPPLQVNIQPVGDTIRSTPTTLYFTVTGLASGAMGSGARSATSTIDAAGGPAPVWSAGANNSDVSGTLTVTLGTGNHTIVVTFCDSGTCTSATTIVAVRIAPPPSSRNAPVVTVERGAARHRAITGCAGCADAVLAYATPAYRSLDTDRSVQLGYSSALAAPMGLVVLDVDPYSSSLPATISLSLLYNGTALPLTSGGTEVVYTARGGQNRLTAQFDASAFPTSWYWVTAVVRNHYADGEVLETMRNVPVLIQNERAAIGTSSGFGNGWYVAGEQQLRLPEGTPGDAVIAADGRLTRFVSCGLYCWSPGDDGSRIERNTNGWGGLQRRYVDGTIVWFNDGTGPMRAMITRLGQSTGFEHDASGRLTRITDPIGQQTTIAWSAARGAAGTVSVTTPGGRTSTFTLDAAGQLTQVTDPDGVVALTATYVNNRLMDATDRLGGTTSFTYDRFGALATVRAPTIQTEDAGAMRLMTTVTSRELALMPVLGQGTASAPASAVSPDSVFLTVRSPHGATSAVSANGAGDPLVMITRGDGGAQADTTVVGYDATDQLASVRTSGGVNQQYSWGTDGMLASIRDNATGVTTAYLYNSLGQDTSVMVNGRVVQQKVYSTDGRSVLTMVITGSDTTRITKDGVGRPLTVTDGGHHTRTFSYGSSGFQNLTSSTKAGQTVTVEYDAHGRPATVTDPLGQSATLGYDVLNRSLSTTAPAAGTSHWAYDDANRTATFIDAIGQAFSTRVNALGALIERTGPATPALHDQYRYDSRGNLSSYTTRAGMTGQVQHDSLGRPTQIAASNASPITISHDPAGKWVAYENVESTDTVFVDGSGRVAKQVSVRGNAAFALVSGFGDYGTRRTLTATSNAWAGGRSLTFGVDTLGRPNRVGDRNGNLTELSYNADGQLQKVTLPTGGANSHLQLWTNYLQNDRPGSVTANISPEQFSMRYQYDNLDRTIIQERGVYPSLKRRDIEYDPAGRMKYWSDHQPVQGNPTLVCDDPMQPASCHNEYPVVDSLTAQERLAYDNVGNRTDGAVIQPGDRMTSLYGWTMSYDDDGNLVSKSGNGVSQTFTWNGLGQMISATTNGVTTSYGYDGLGRRVRKTTNGTTTRYLYDGANLAMQLNALGVPELEFSYYPGVDHPHSLRQANGTVLYYIADASSNVRALVNGSNQTVNAYEYSPAGRLLSATEPVAQPFHFAGRELDPETQLYYNRARYYDPSVGRFISEDPIGLAGGVNPYVYTGNNPVDFTDPSGLEWRCAEFSDRTVCTWTDPIQYLAAVHISAVGNSSGASANFGNPNARGGSLSGTLAQGTSTGGGFVASAVNAISNDCTAASASVALDLLSGALLVSGGLEVRAALVAADVTGTVLSRAAYYATVNGGRSSLRRLSASLPAYVAARQALNPAVGGFGMDYMNGAVDDAFRGAGLDTFVPFLGLRNSIPNAWSACR
ncbi:MAG: repeat protein [Gemmatimonadetes bacterium]|nr:repeat protein [Gemmatimonadota bacterium]